MRHVIFCGVMLCLAAAARGEEKTENYPEGGIKAKYGVDADGRRNGPYEGYYPEGKIKIKTSYKAGELDGSYTEYYPDGAGKVAAAYRAGKLSGSYTEKSPKGAARYLAQYKDGKLDGKVTVKNEDGTRTLSEQTWAGGALTQLDGINPYPRTLASVRETIGRILDPPVKSPKDPKADPAPAAAVSERDGALRCLQAYRYLCEVPYDDLSYDPQYDRLAEAAAGICEKNGGLSHTPPNPGLPADQYKLAQEGASKCNLAMWGINVPLSTVIHFLMNDSDPYNITRLGHRRWILNPPIKRFGIGRSGAFSALYVFDSSRKGKTAFDIIPFPARGYMPAEYFGARHAWSVMLNPATYQAPDKAGIKIFLYPLDDRMVKAEKPLDLDYVNVEKSLVPCIMFRPGQCDVTAGHRYWVDIEGVKKGGKPAAIKYVVEFVSLEAEKKK